MNDIFKMIDLYFDGELNKSKEGLLFSQLSSNEEAREYFKKANLLSTTIKDTVHEFPGKLEERIFRNISSSEENPLNLFLRKNIFAIMSYAVALIMIAAALFYYSQSIAYKEKLDRSSVQINQQNKLINLLYNSMPATEVRTTVDYKVVVSENL